MNSDRWMIGLLLGLTLLAYGPVWKADFITADDQNYIRQNPHLQKGLSWEGMGWAFSLDRLWDRRHCDYWQPLTFVSRMIDVELFGFNPSMHHGMNLLFHAANVLLVYGLLRQMTGALGRSALAAAWFAVHPLHVESVAWVTERKDVLSGFFFLLTIFAYHRHALAPSLWRYAAVIILFAMGLMAKPVVLTLPIVLLLLDHWPLRRWPVASNDCKRQIFLVIEKFPLALLSCISVAFTLVLHAQAIGHGTMIETGGLMVLGYGVYLLKAFLPTGLAFFHPAPVSLPVGWMLAAALTLVVITVAVCRQGTRHPYLATGWFWFLIMLAPGIALKEMLWAERFAYLPNLGLYILFAWMLGDATRRRPRLKRGMKAALGLTLGCMVILTWRQAEYWRDSLALFGRAIAVTENNWLAHTNYGYSLAQMGRIDEAILHFQTGVRLHSNSGSAHNSLGAALARKGDLQGAVRHFQSAIQQEPDLVIAYSNLGAAFTQMGQVVDGDRAFRRALEINPDFAMAHFGLGNNLLQEQKVDEAMAHFARLAGQEPASAEVQYKLALCLALKEQTQEARIRIAVASRLNPRANYVRRLQQDIQTHRIAAESRGSHQNSPSGRR
ncbi:MAG: tetratricopeptide repeat protein [Verrucomicrobia bacterium]|nr:tetratricopeptide repeat protein [Verrucomicrobiota bacterium]